MKCKKEEKGKINLFYILCVIVVLVSMLPISCNYIMNGGIVSDWIRRINEIVEGINGGKLVFFPSETGISGANIKENAMNSNLWFLIPGVLCAIFKNIVLSYRIYMALIQIGTALTTLWCLKKFCDEESGRTFVLFGFLLYMVCPYRIYICYDMVDLSQAVVWMLLPVLAGAIRGMLLQKKTIKYVCLTAVALAGIGYADAVFFVILCAVVLGIGVIKKQINLVLSMIGGSVLFGPGLYRLLLYLFTDRFDYFSIQTESIMKNGYRLGEFFSVYTWKEGHPGMGMGLLLCLLAGIWLRFVKGDAAGWRMNKWLLIMAFIASAMATCRFPWDLVQRLGSWALKFVTLLETPAVFWGIANSVLCIPAARYMERISDDENELMAKAVPIIVILFCIGGCIYQCNMLTIERGALIFQ